MKNDFVIVRESGVVSIVRGKTSAPKSTKPVQRMKVLCFDSAQIDRIIRIQENSMLAVPPKKKLGSLFRVIRNKELFPISK